MRLKLLILAIPLVLPLGGCVVHFPLGENGPSLASQEDTSSSDAGTLAQAPTEPNTHAVVNGNSANTPDIPR
ncbi:MAG TPA: hypothetical protein VKP60_21425 [Magnetospirillaceae bacterium]|nr:hypothetical protein [Magnetospirillaceae bacterium]